jgi:hypothetical protein
MEVEVQSEQSQPIIYEKPKKDIAEISLDRVTEGYDSIQDIICKKCKFILPESGTEVCGRCHKTYYCWACSSDLYDKKQQCIGCRKLYDPVKMPEEAKLKLETLKITCKMAERGCTEILSYNQLNEHEFYCRFDMVTCKEGCKKDFHRSVFKEHDATCPEIKQRCEKKCGFVGQKIKMEHDCAVYRFRKGFLWWCDHEQSKFNGELLDIMQKKVDEEKDEVIKKEGQTFIDEARKTFASVPAPVENNPPVEVK